MRKSSTGSKIFVVCSILIAVVGTIVAINYCLDPLTYQHSQQAEVGAAWANGENVAMLDANVDLRELRREHIKRMKDTPDLIIFGGSRFQEAGSVVAPGKKMYNAFVSNDHFEDMMAFVQLLDENKKLPKTLILSARFSTFEYLGGREAWWWKSFAPEYQAMAQRLGIKQYSPLELMSYEKWTHLFSAEAAYGRVERFLATKAVWKSTTAEQDPMMDTIGSDGALRFSKDYLRSATLEYARKDSLARVEIDNKNAPKINTPLLAQMEKLLFFLKEKGVRVVLLQTPYNPTYYDKMKGTEFVRSINKIEYEVQQIAKKTDVFVGGGFDPIAQGCKESDFRDFNHSNVDCMKKLVASVPNL